MRGVDSEDFGRRLRDQHPIAISDDDEAITDLLDQLMAVDWKLEKAIADIAK